MTAETAKSQQTDVAGKPLFTTVLGTRVHMIQIPEVLRRMETWIEGSRTRCRQIVVTGMHGVIEGHKDPRFRQILNSAELLIPDGISVTWIGRLRGFPLRERACGADLMHAFFRRANEKGYRSFFYGDTPQTLGRMRTRLECDFPGMQVAGMFSPPFRRLTADEDNEILERINAAAPDVLWVALGLPKQERWISERLDRLNVPLAVGVGAAFGFVARTIKRVPRWIGEAGFEWLWRFVHEPKKLWRRDLIDGPHFLFHVFLEMTGIKRYD